MQREVFEETGIEVKNHFTHYGFCELMSTKIQQHKIVMLLHAKSEGTALDTEEGEAAWYPYEKAEPHLLAFAREAIRIWKSKEVYFRLTEKEVDLRNHTFPS